VFLLLQVSAISPRSDAQEQVFDDHQAPTRICQSIETLQTSLDQLRQLMIHQQQPLSFLAKLRRFFGSFKFSFTPPADAIDEHCSEILQRNQLTKQKLFSIYHLFDRNDTFFLNWLQTIMPNYFLPPLLNYVKHLDSIPTDNM
jgi:hypothetical protein